MLAKTLEFARNGTPVNTVTLIVTDGNDEGSGSTARQVYPIVSDMLAQECHIVAGMGIDDGSTDFRRVFREMGIPDSWILTPRNDPKEIRRAFQIVLAVGDTRLVERHAFQLDGASGISMGGFNV